MWEMMSVLHTKGLQTTEVMLLRMLNMLAYACVCVCVSLQQSNVPKDVTGFFILALCVCVCVLCMPVFAITRVANSSSFFVFPTKMCM